MFPSAEPVRTDGMASTIIIDVKVASSSSGCEIIGSVVRGESFCFLNLPNIFERAFILLNSEVVRVSSMESSRS